MQGLLQQSLVPSLHQTNQQSKIHIAKKGNEVSYHQNSSFSSGKVKRRHTGSGVYRSEIARHVSTNCDGTEKGRGPAFQGLERVGLFKLVSNAVFGHHICTECYAERAHLGRDKMNFEL